MGLYSKLFLRTKISPYGDFTRNSVLSFDDLDQNFLFLKERDIQSFSISGTVLNYNTTGGDVYSIDLDSIVDSAANVVWKTGSTGNFSIKAINDSGLDATGNYSVAEGFNTTASGDYSHAEGNQTQATGTTSHAEGESTVASGDYSHAEGYGNIASGPGSHAEGGYNFDKISVFNTASGISSHAEGFETIASGDYGSHAEGFQTQALGESSHSEGKNTIASGQTSHAEGEGTLASGGFSHAEGGSTTASGTASHAEGLQTQALGESSHAEGRLTEAAGDSSHAEGVRTTASGVSSHAEGQLSNAIGDTSHAEGYDTTASGSYSHAEGRETIATGTTSHAEGQLSNAIGDTSHAEGYATTASGDYSHAEGSITEAAGDSSHAEGVRTTASGDGSHAEGIETTASNKASHAEGGYTVSSGSFSHAEGNLTTASGDEGSHAEGNQTTASGPASHAEGRNTIASGDFSHAGGNNSTVSGSESFIHSTNSLLTGNRSVLLGGSGLTGTTDDTVYVPNLNINNVSTGTSINNLGIDASGNVIIGGAGGSVNVSPTTLIVSNSGDNDTAVKGSLTNPYAGLVYAANQAVSGDTIYVMAGDYSISNEDWSGNTYGYSGQTGTTLFRDGVTWQFEAGTNVTNDVDRVHKNVIFYAKGDDISCDVFGDANFDLVYESGNGSANPRILYLSGGTNGPSFTLECNDIQTRGNYNAFEIRGFENVDITSKGTWTHNWGTGIYVIPKNTNSNVINFNFNRIILQHAINLFVGPMLASGSNTAPYRLNFDFNHMSYEGDNNDDGIINSYAINSIYNINGKTIRSTDTLTDELFHFQSQGSTYNIHVDDCVATGVTRSMISISRAFGSGSDPNKVKFTGRYHTNTGNVISDALSSVLNDDEFVFDGVFTSDNSVPVYITKDNANVEIGGEIRHYGTGATDYGISITTDNSNIKLRDLEIVTQGADAINSSVATEIDIVGTLTTNTDVNSNVTLRGIHNLNNVSKPDDLTVRGREILSQTVGSISTTGSTLDWSLSNNFDYTLTTGTTFTFTGDTDGQTIVMGLTQDGTGGHTVTWPASVKWAAGGTEPTMTSTSGSTDVYTLIKINGTVYGSYIQDFQ